MKSPKNALLFFFFLTLLLLLGACATVPVGQAPPSGDTGERDRIVEYAESLLGRTSLEGLGRGFRSDCSGYIVGIFRTLGHTFVIEPTPNDGSIAQALFDTLRKRRLLYSDRRPKKGDLVFFKGTTERRRYRVSHIGLIAGVRDDETVLIIHYTASGGVQEMTMNLRSPGSYRNKRGYVINDFLKKGPGDRLSGQLFYSYGDLFQYVKSFGPGGDRTAGQ
jgi:hypothetical protein